MGSFWGLVSETVDHWQSDKAQRLGAALAYYAAFSLAPLLVLVVAITSFVYRQDGLARIQSQIAMMAGASAADAIVAMIRGVKSTGGGIVATVLGILTLLLGATGMFVELQDAMNTIWHVQPKPGAVWADIVRSRVVSFLMVFAICAALLLSVGLTAFLANISKYFQSLLPFTQSAWPLVDFGCSVLVSAILFAAIFKILPDVPLAWRDVWLGAAVTAVLFAIGKIAIGFYLGRSSFASAYGAAGSLLVVLAWVYYSAQILFLGAEFTYVYTRRRKQIEGERPIDRRAA
jgi:membrane protein